MLLLCTVVACSAQCWASIMLPDLCLLAAVHDFC